MVRTRILPKTKRACPKMAHSEGRSHRKSRRKWSLTKRRLQHPQEKAVIYC